MFYSIDKFEVHTVQARSVNAELQKAAIEW